MVLAEIDNASPAKTTQLRKLIAPLPLTMLVWETDVPKLATKYLNSQLLPPKARRDAPLWYLLQPMLTLRTMHF